MRRQNNETLTADIDISYDALGSLRVDVKFACTRRNNLHLVRQIFRWSSKICWLLYEQQEDLLGVLH